MFVSFQYELHAFLYRNTLNFYIKIPFKALYFVIALTKPFIVIPFPHSCSTLQMAKFTTVFTCTI